MQSFPLRNLNIQVAFTLLIVHLQVSTCNATLGSRLKHIKYINLTFICLCSIAAPWCCIFVEVAVPCIQLGTLLGFQDIRGICCGRVVIRLTGSKSVVRLGNTGWVAATHIGGSRNIVVRLGASTGRVCCKALLNKISTRTIIKKP